MFLKASQYAGSNAMTSGNGRSDAAQRDSSNLDSRRPFPGPTHEAESPWSSVLTLFAPQMDLRTKSL